MPRRLSHHWPHRPTKMTMPLISVSKTSRPIRLVDLSFLLGRVNPGIRNFAHSSFRSFKLFGALARTFAITHPFIFASSCHATSTRDCCLETKTNSLSEQCPLRAASLTHAGSFNQAIQLNRRIGFDIATTDRRGTAPLPFTVHLLI